MREENERRKTTIRMRVAVSAEWVINDEKYNDRRRLWVVGKPFFLTISHIIRNTEQGCKIGMPTSLNKSVLLFYYNLKNLILIRVVWFWFSGQLKYQQRLLDKVRIL